MEDHFLDCPPIALDDARIVGRKLAGDSHLRPEFRERGPLG
jgi:hypothetical protein